jgi:hypothetical protein
MISVYLAQRGEFHLLRVSCISVMRVLVVDHRLIAQAGALTQNTVSETAELWVITDDDRAVVERCSSGKHLPMYCSKIEPSVNI